MSAALAESLARARRLVSSRTGIVADVRFLETGPEEPAVFWAQSRPADLRPLAGRPSLNYGNATAGDPGRATMKAVGESIERYCAAFYDERDLRLATHEDLAPDAVRPEDFSLFTDAQYNSEGFPFAPFTLQTRVNWVAGHSLLDECPRWVPASFVYIPYDRAPGEPPLKDLISTGLACGQTRLSATLKALCEAVERDAYSIAWQHSLRRPHVDLDHVDDPGIQRLLAAMRRVPVRLHAVLLTLDIPIPVFLIVMTRDRPPYTVVASGCDLNPRQALYLALEEACLALIGMGRAAAAEPWTPDADYSSVTTMHMHGLAHAHDPRLRQASAFLTQPSALLRVDELPDVSTGDPAADLRTAVAAIRPFVSDVVAVDVTTEDVDDAGFKVVRVVVPDLVPMDVDHQYRHLGGRRLYDVPLALGLSEVRADPSGLNPAPHPFP